MFSGVPRELTGRLFDRLVVVFVVIGFLVLFASGGVIVWAVQKNQTFSRWVAHTLEVETNVAVIQVLVERAESGRRGYLLTGNPGYLRVISQAQAEQGPAMDSLVQLTADNPVQQNRGATLRNLLGQQRSAADDERGRVQAGRRDEALLLFESEGARVIRALRSETAAMIAEETRLFEARTAAQQASAALLYVVLGVGAVLVLLVGAGSVFIIRRYTHDLAGSRDRLRALNFGLEDAVRDRTADLTRANEEIQRFAYIVSHDLRSPLVNVMGFTSELEVATKDLHGMLERVEQLAPEVATPQMREAIERDLPEAIGFIRTSTQKMDRLINAILRLSREGRRVISPEPLDMDALVQGIGDTLRHRLDEAGAELVIESPLPPVDADRLAVEQILGNLMENAVKYLKPGRPGRIVVRGRREPGRLIYEVQDNGRGIDPKDHERVFELFRRSGVQDQAGEGIGLAHVRALGYRLGGTVTCESELDRGATFRLTLASLIPATRESERA